MENKNNSNARISQDGQTMIVKVNGQTALLSVNLVKYLLGISYTKKDGTVVSEAEIESMKAKSKEAYAKAIQAKSAVA